MRLRACRGPLHEWGLAFLLAIGLLTALHLWALAWVTVRSTSMYATLVPGDLVAVQRWPSWSGLEHGDIIVFRDPLQDHLPKGQRQLLVKRIAGLPGDELELRDGALYVNGKRTAPLPAQTSSWSVRLEKGAGPAELLSALSLPLDLRVPAPVIDLPLNDSLAALAEARPEVAGLAPRASARHRSTNLFPFGPGYKWTHDDYGPLRVPAAGDTVPITMYTLPMYDRLISRYEHGALHVVDGKLMIDGVLAERYAVQQDYYFVLGDSRDHSSDSRYWGFVPAELVIGRAGLVLLNARLRSERGMPMRVLRPL